MTTYTTTAIATNSVTNTVTVASISNMFSGLPITFSGVTFGGITQGSTYYIGTITYGYPTSQITLNSLPGGAVFQLTTATGTMTAAWSSGGQQIIVTTPPGENLNTAFTKINTNFDQLWAAGPVNSNIKISNNTIYTLDTNGDLILNPNGTGNVVANAHVVPDTTLIRNLGSPTRVWNDLYAKYADIGNIAIGQLTIPVGNLHITGGTNGQYLQTDGAGNLDWNTIPLSAGGNNTQIQYNNTGVLDGSNTFTFNNSTNTVTVANIDTTAVANLNNVSNVRIGGGTTGFVLQTDGTGNLSWAAPLGNTQIILDQQLVGDSNTTQFNLITPAFTNSVLVSLNGVQQLPNVAYSISGNVISFTEAPATSDVIDIRFLTGGQGNNTSPGGANGSIQFNSGDGFGGTANLTYNQTTGNLYTANVVVSGNATASYYYGDGSYLTGITATANTGTITFANNIISTSNANAAVNLLAPQQTSVSVATGGNAATAQLLWATNIGALSPAQINNGILAGNSWGTQISVGNTGAVIGSNSVAGLQTWTFGTAGTLSGAGGVVAGNITSGSDVTATANISAVGNVIGTYILGNVAFATGVPQSYGNSNVYALLNGSAANIVPLANVSYSLGNATNQWKDIWVSNSTIYMNSVPITVSAGNVLTVAGNSVVTTTSGSTSLGNIGFNGNTVYDLNGINLNNSDLSHGATAAVVVPANGNSDPVQVNNTYGNVVLQSGVAGNIIAAWLFGNNGKLSLPGGGLIGDTYSDNANAAGLQAGPGGYAVINSYDHAQYVQADDANVYIGTGFGDTNQSWTFDQTGNITLPGNTSSINYANGEPYGGSTGNPFDQDLNTGNSVTFANVSATGNVNSGNIYTGQISATGNIIVANANISGANYITGNFFAGDGSGLSNISVSANTGNVTFNNSTIVGPSFGVAPSANSSVYIQPTVDSATVYQFSGATMSAPGNVTAAGNITGNYILGNGSQLTGLPATYGNSNVTTLLSGFGSNAVSTTGNISAGYLFGNASQLTGLPATYGNSNVATFLAAFGSNTISTTGTITSGNITSGNVLTGGLISATGNTTVGNLSTAGQVSATGNITGNYILGNGSQLTGLPATYGNSNVTTLLAGLGSNAVSTTGNISAGYLFGNGSQLTGIAAGYSNSNVATFLAAFGSNTVSTTGNITSGNAIILGNSSTGVYALDIGATATFLSNTVASFTANVNNYTQTTLQNLNTGADATADFVITANNGNDTVNYSDFGIINSGYDNATPTNSLGNIVFAADTYLYAQGNTGNASQSGGNLAIGTTVPGKNVKIFAGGITNSAIVANIGNTGVAVTGTVSATGNITAQNFIGNGAALTNVTVSVAGNVVGSQANVGIVAGSYNWSFNNTGNLTLPGNTFAVNYANNTPVNVVTKFEGTWTVPTGNSTQSFTVSPSETYYMWVDCNIPNGILVWNATATITNTNVPVVGAQYAWVYNGGGTPIDFTSIPNQFTGTSNTIVRSSTAPSATTNKFDFGINNTSGSAQTVRYGWIQISY